MATDVLARGLAAKALAEALAGGGGGGATYPEVATWADLPSAAAHSGDIYVVQTTTGLIGFRKLAGLWRSDGANWIYLGLYGRNASEIVNVPAGGVAATDVQGAIDELDSEAGAHYGAGGVAHAAATGGAAGFMSAADKSKLDGVAAGATANDTDANLKARANHTGTQAIATIAAAATARLFGRTTAGGGPGEELTAAQVKAILAIIAADISGFNEAVDDRVAALIAAGTGIVESYDDAGNLLTISVSNGVDPWTWTKLAGANVANSTVTLANVGLSFSANANTTYLVEVVGTFQSAATTTGMALALDIPSGTVAGQMIHPVSATGLGSTEQIADAATTGASTGVRAATTNVPFMARFIVVIGVTGGTVNLMFRSEVAASAVTIIGANQTAMGARVI